MAFSLPSFEIIVVVLLGRNTGEGDKLLECDEIVLRRLSVCVGDSRLSDVANG